jgi:hypothetical protein
MGMDVFGKNPTNKVGKYFRRNVWGWHPLWEYVENVHPEIAGLVKHAHSNDGDGLGAVKSAELARHLRDDIDNGVVAEYVAERNKHLSELPREECNLCNGSGIRTDEVGVEHGHPTRELEPEIAIIVGRTHGWCNKCQGEGLVDSFALSYYLDESDIEEFARFLEYCGGFKIC